MNRILCSIAIAATLFSSPAFAEDSAAVTNGAWKLIVLEQIDLAEKQTPKQKPITRFCEAAMKTCTSVIFAKRDGTMTMVSEIENLDEKLIARMICKINNLGDIRTCVDFDRRTVKREVYDAGHWRTVEGR